MKGTTWRAGLGLVPLLAAGLAACGAQDHTTLTAGTQPADLQCIEIPDGYYLFANGKFTPASPELAAVATEVTQKRVAWIHEFESRMREDGHEWLRLEAIGKVLLMSGSAGSEAERDETARSVTAAIASDRGLTARNLYVVDAIATPGTPRPPASLYSTIPHDPSIEVCRTKADQLAREGAILYGNEDRSVAEASHGLLDAMAGLALICDDYKLEVGVHTDARGAQDFNLERSRKRAETIVAYLAGQGVPQDGLVAVGYGENHPLDPAQTSEAYARNSRVEFFFLRPPE